MVVFQKKSCLSVAYQFGIQNSKTASLVQNGLTVGSANIGHKSLRPLADEFLACGKQTETNIVSGSATNNSALFPFFSVGSGELAKSYGSAMSIDKLDVDFGPPTSYGADTLDAPRRGSVKHARDIAPIPDIKIPGAAIPDIPVLDVVGAQRKRSGSSSDTPDLRSQLRRSLSDPCGSDDGNGTLYKISPRLDGSEERYPEFGRCMSGLDDAGMCMSYGARRGVGPNRSDRERNVGFHVFDHAGLTQVLTHLQEDQGSGDKSPYTTPPCEPVGIMSLPELENEAATRDSLAIQKKMANFVHRLNSSEMEQVRCGAECPTPIDR